jgi:hypothetical protein
LIALFLCTAAQGQIGNASFGFCIDPSYQSNWPSCFQVEMCMQHKECETVECSEPCTVNNECSGFLPLSVGGMTTWCYPPPGGIWFAGACENSPRPFTVTVKNNCTGSVSTKPLFAAVGNFYFIDLDGFEFVFDYQVSGDWVVYWTL